MQIDILELVKDLLGAPLPAILTLAGVAFIFLSFFKLKVVERAEEGNPWVLRGVGLAFVVAGVALYLVAPPAPGQEVAGDDQAGQPPAFDCQVGARAEATTGVVPGHADIDTPKGGSVLPRLNAVSGTYQDLPEDAELWVLVYTWMDGRFYPQSQDDPPAPARKDSETNWSTAAFIGLEGDEGIGDCYDIVVVAADEAANQRLIEMMDDWSDRGNWPGLDAEELPDGLEEKDAVTVQRGF